MKLFKITMFSIAGVLTPICMLGVLLSFGLFRCQTMSEQKNKAFNAVNLDDTIDAVIQRLGRPSKIQHSLEPFGRYTSSKCEGACRERFWYENRICLDIQAWSIEFDGENKVIGKNHWVSP